MAAADLVANMIESATVAVEFEINLFPSVSDAAVVTADLSVTELNLAVSAASTIDFDIVDADFFVFATDLAVAALSNSFGWRCCWMLNKLVDGLNYTHLQVISCK